MEGSAREQANAGGKRAQTHQPCRSKRTISWFDWPDLAKAESEPKTGKKATTVPPKSMSHLGAKKRGQDISNQRDHRPARSAQLLSDQEKPTRFAKHRWCQLVPLGKVSNRDPGSVVSANHRSWGRLRTLVADGGVIAEHQRGKRVSQCAAVPLLVSANDQCPQVLEKHTVIMSDGQNSNPETRQ